MKSQLKTNSLLLLNIHIWILSKIYGINVNGQDCLFQNVGKKKKKKEGKALKNALPMKQRRMFIIR